MRQHPKLAAQIRHEVEHYLHGLIPPVETDEDLAAEAAAIDVDVETLREWRKEYQWWGTDDEWRHGMVDMLTGTILRDIAEPGPHNWRRWKITRRVVHHLSLLGVIAGSGYAFDWSGTKTYGIKLTGTRYRHSGNRAWPSYVLYWPTRKWRCLLVYRHWPNDDLIAFGMCSKCCPCPECHQSVPLHHACAGTIAAGSDGTTETQGSDA